MTENELGEYIAVLTPRGVSAMRHRGSPDRGMMQWSDCVQLSRVWNDNE